MAFRVETITERDAKGLGAGRARPIVEQHERLAVKVGHGVQCVVERIGQARGDLRMCAKARRAYRGGHAIADQPSEQRSAPPCSRAHSAGAQETRAARRVKLVHERGVGGGVDAGGGRGRAAAARCSSVSRPRWYSGPKSEGSEPSMGRLPTLHGDLGCGTPSNL